MVRTITDKDGNTIFRFNNRTKNIELSNGDALPVVKFSVRDTATTPENSSADSSLLLPEGYRTESKRPVERSRSYEFIVDQNGKSNLGEIFREIANVVSKNATIEIKPLPIRLMVGNENGGYRHLAHKHLEEIKGKGFEDVISYIKHIVSNFDKIYQSTEKDNCIILHCKSDDSKGYMPLELKRYRRRQHKIFNQCKR